jgi:hypothetical protein
VARVAGGVRPYLPADPSNDAAIVAALDEEYYARTADGWRYVPGQASLPLPDDEKAAGGR